MAEHGPLAAKFAEAGARMMARDRSSFGTVFAVDAVWQVNGRTIAEGRDNIVNAVVATMDQTGWVDWELTSSVEQDRFVGMIKPGRCSRTAAVSTARRRPASMVMARSLSSSPRPTSHSSILAGMIVGLVFVVARRAVRAVFAAA